MTHIKFILIAIDQLINTVFNGYPDETFSSRCYRWHRDKKRNYPMVIVNTLLFFDYNHCEESYRSEVLRRQLPLEFRKEMEI